MTIRYALAGERSGELLSFGGQVLVHGDRAELDFLVPIGARVVTLPAGIPEEQTMPLSAHPELAGLRWPLRKDDFR